MRDCRVGTYLSINTSFAHKHVDECLSVSHLLGVPADCGEDADSTTVQLIPAPCPDKLKVESLVEIPNTVGLEKDP